MKKYTFIVPMDVEYNFYSKDVKTAIDTLLMNHNQSIKGEIWNDIHRITGTEGYTGSTIIEKNENDNTEKTYYLINNKPKLLNKQRVREQRDS
mgnify:FL=1|tara:strand:+ start:4028 stop:4306 length:279 start_codon:yes stop_codon:yes gene_type:complete